MKLAAAALAVFLATAAAGPHALAAPRKPPSGTRPPATTVAPQARQTAISSQLRTLREQVAEASAEEAEALDRVDQVAGRRRLLDGRVSAIDGQLAAIAAEEVAATARLAVLEADLRRAEAKMSAAEMGLASARSELADRAVTAYVHPPGSYVASALLERRSFRELAAARELLRAVLDAQAVAVQQYRDLRDGLTEERTGIDSARGSLAAQQQVVAARREALVATRQRQADLRAEVATEEAQERAVLEDVRTRVKSFEDQIAALRKESDAISAMLRTRQVKQPAAGAAKGLLAAPVPGAITSTFGPRRHPIFGTTRMHTGIDFSGTTGTPVRSAADGIVVVAGDRGGYGTTVVVDHGNGLATLYAHQSRVAVAPGAAVARGAVIGYVGSSGYSTAPHLHFEVRSKGTPVDPQRYL